VRYEVTSTVIFNKWLARLKDRQAVKNSNNRISGTLKGY
jgi:putative component of toxin-antitoxin plasmid stabilization module